MNLMRAPNSCPEREIAPWSRVLSEIQNTEGR
nr:MAG TPA: hypothetical protein [Bacteriophage sp.]